MGFCSFLVQLTPWELVAGVGASAVLGASKSFW